MLMQWDSFQSYFLSTFDLDDDPAENDPDEKPRRKRSLANAFKQPAIKLCAMFFQSVIPIFHSFNTFLQPKESLIYILHHCTLRLYCLLLSIFIRPEVTSESEYVLSIDLEDPDFNSIFIGEMTQQHPRDSYIVRTSKYKKFLKEGRPFSIKCTKYLQTNINAIVKK